MDYLVLGPGGAEQLRRDRLLELEIEHARIALILEEDPANKHAQRDIAEVTRRIEHHRGKLATAEEPQAEESVT